MTIMFNSFDQCMHGLISHDCWDELGLVPHRHVIDKDNNGVVIAHWHYKVIDKRVFMLAVIKYGIRYVEVKCSM